MLQPASASGKVSHEMAKQIAESEYDRFTFRRLDENKNQLSDFDKAIKQVETKKKKNN